MEIPTGDRTTGEFANQAIDHKLLMSSKPLHRFGQKEPKSLGIVILILGCAEVMMGFTISQMETRYFFSSNNIYIPFWQGALFLVCGNLSIYTEIRPSKRMVTVCLAMYVVSLLGILVSFGYRIYVLGYYSHRRYLEEWEKSQKLLHVSIEGTLFASSLCVLALLIFLIIAARLTLKSTRTQVIVQCIPPPPSDTPSG